jgi:hypothetical protein
MPREGWDGSERYDDGGQPEGPSGIPWRGSNRPFTRGAECDGARVSVPTSMARDDGQTEAVPVRERRGTGSARGRRGASLPAEHSRWADAAGVRRGSGTGRHGAEGGRLAGPGAKRGEGADRGVSGQEQAGEPQGTSALTTAQGRRRLAGDLGGRQRKSAGHLDTGFDVRQGHRGAGREEAVVAHLHEAPGQHVLEEAAHELHNRQGHGAHSVAVRLLIPEADIVRIDGLDAVLPDRHLEHVRGEVLQRPIAVARGLTVDVPLHHPDLGRNVPEQAALVDLIACERRATLEEEIREQRLVLPVRRLAADGLEAWAEVQRRGYEGVVAKEENAPYRRSTRWLKSKLRQEGRFVIGGVAMARAGHQGGVLIGEWEGKRLRYRGFVDLGLSRGALDTLRTDAQPLARPVSPFADLQRRKDTVWLEPVLEAEVSYGRIVGGQLRDPVLRRFVTEQLQASRTRRPSERRSSTDRS